MGFKDQLKAVTGEVNEEILKFLPAEEGFQRTIFEASNYSVINGGKRLRPIMMMCAYLLVRGKFADQRKPGEPGGPGGPGKQTDTGLLPGNGGSGENGALKDGAGIMEQLDERDRKILLPFMAAIEMIHSSSLVHDDLPCMDNDTLRRGVPSTWAEYGEDMGTLAGDALMIYAFETASRSGAEADRKCRAIDILAHKTGIYGMIGGQTVDVELTGGTPTSEQLEFIYRLKTGALIEASFMIGAVLAGADDKTVAVLEEAAGCIGMAFQIQDDILDVTSTEEELGKPIGSDAGLGKVTWLTYYGMEQSLKDVEEYTKRAVRLIRSVGSLPFLEELAVYLVGRKS